MPSYQVLPPILSNLFYPTAVAVGIDERIYVAESSQDRVLVYDASGRYQTNLSGLARPTSVAAGPDGLLYVGNAGRGNVEIYSSDFALIGELGQGSSEFARPTGITVDSEGNVYVADGEANQIKVYRPDFTFNFSFGSSGTLNGQFQRPTAIAINEATGELYITDLAVAFSWSGGSGRVQVFDLNGAFQRSFMTQDGTGTPFIRPLGIAVDEAGRVYVSDSYQNVVAVYEGQGAYLGNIYDAAHPLRNPKGMVYAPGSNRLFVVSLNTASVETYGIDAQYAGVSLTPASHDFGELVVGSVSAAQGFDVSNNGDADLVIGTVIFSGTDTSDFAFLSDNCSDQILAPGGSCSIEVTFSPTSGSDKSARLDIPTNDIYAPVASAALGGVSTLPQYELSVVSGGAGVGAVQGSGINCGADCAQSYDAGSLITLTAVPQIGSKFDGWSGGSCGGTGSCVVTLNGNIEVTALFSPLPVAVYSVTASAGIGGTISPAGETLALAGSTVSYSIVPDDGYHVVDVLIDGASGGERSSFSFMNLSADHTIMARFEADAEEDPLAFLEVGEVVANHDWKRVNFNKTFTDPVVVAKPASYNGGDPGVVRIRNLDATGFEVRIQEWNYRDGQHTNEAIGYLVVEQGRHALPDGALVEAGTFNTANTADFGAVAFDDTFNATPVVSASVLTFNGGDTVAGRLRNIDVSGFDYRMQEQEANAQAHIEETIGYIAWEPSMGIVGGLLFEVGKTADVVDHQFKTLTFNAPHLAPPLFVADMQTTDGTDVANLRWRNRTAASIQVQVDEEQSKDAEVIHTTEVIGYLAFSAASIDPALDSDGDGLSDVDELNLYGTNALAMDTDQDGIDDGDEVAYWGLGWGNDNDSDGQINLLDADADNDGYQDGLEKLKGSDAGDALSVPELSTMVEAGEAVANHLWQRIDFSTTFHDAVVVAKPAGYNGGDPAVVRVRNVDATGFEIRIQEWDYRDGVHVFENISYIAMERGSHRLADGTLVEAGRFDTDATANFAPTSFSRAFNVAPVVTAAITSYNGSDAVTGRLRNIGTTGFDYRMQEQEAYVQVHATETISYIAWEPSSGTLGGVSFEVSKTPDVITHYFSPISFSGLYLGAPAFVADMQTTDGADVANLRWRSKDTTGIEVRVNEEQSGDSEMSHTTEVVGYIVIDVGVSP